MELLNQENKEIEQEIKEHGRVIIIVKGAEITSTVEIIIITITITGLYFVEKDINLVVNDSKN
jgi:hypothetical protein